jgi:RNA polymerase sigma-70 factor (ECF subfamily)
MSTKQAILAVRADLPTPLVFRGLEELNRMPTPRIKSSRPVDLEEYRLVVRARKGDKQAFEDLYRKFVPRVFGLCRRMVQDVSLAEELTQEVFIRVWEKLPLFKGKRPFAPWLLTVTSRHVISNRRKEARKLSRIRAVEDLELVEGSNQVRNPLRHGTAGLGIDLENAIAQLPKGARKVLVLHDIEGYKHQEIADFCGMAVGTSKAQLHRARRLLREELTK